MPHHNRHVAKISSKMANFTENQAFFAILTCLLSGGVFSEECQRYSLQEFQSTLFWPQFESRLTFLTKLLQEGTDASEQILVQFEERKGDSGNPEVAKTKINEIRENGLLVLSKAQLSIEHQWSSILEKESDAAGIRESIKEVKESIKGIEKDFKKVFSDLSQLNSILVKTMVQVMVMGIQNKPLEEQNEMKAKLMDSFKDSDKLFGHVLGKMVLADLDDEVLPTPMFFQPTENLLRNLDDSFYMKAEKLNLSELWKEFLEGNWGTIEIDNLEDKQNLTNQMVELLASIFSHWPELE